MSKDDLAEFRAEMQRRGVYERNEPRRLTPAQRVARKHSRSNTTATAVEATLDPDSVSIKRLAWAFGCAKADSETEGQLYRALVRKVAAILDARKERP